MRGGGILMAGALLMAVTGVCKAGQSPPARQGAAMVLQADSVTPSPAPRWGVSGGMGVEYVNAPDVVDFINATGGGGREPEFKSAVTFFAAATIPWTGDWTLKLEYVYMLFSFNTPKFGITDFTCIVHMPTVVVQYVLAEEGVYNVKAGAGIGFHAGSLKEESSLVNDRRSGSGIGTILDLEANTAFSENFFGYLGADVRWDFIGDLDGVVASGSLAPTPTLDFFSLGARFGFTYYFSPSQ